LILRHIHQETPKLPPLLQKSKPMTRIIAVLLLAFLTACGTPTGLRTVEPIIDAELTGTWVMRKAEFSGKDFPPSGIELQIAGDQYRIYSVSGSAFPTDRGRLVIFGDELAGQARRLDAIGEDGPNKGRRFLSIYRLSANGRQLEVCYDLSEQDRPAEFVSREGTQTFRATYSKK
jgi:uncharacterized protein (TIGR03067 family)